jgi:uncharacterized protein (TIGR02118 family)
MMKEITYYTTILGHQINRRSLLTGSGKLALMAAATTTVTSLAGKPVLAETVKTNTQVTTVLYPSGEGITFNFEYYRDHHLKTIMELYNGLIDRFELRKGMPSPDGSAPRYLAVISIYTSDPDGFAAANEKYREQLVADVPNFTNGQPLFQADEVFAIAE